MKNNQTIIKHIKLILPDQVLNDGWLLIENGKIANYGSGSIPASFDAAIAAEGHTIIDGQGNYMLPGFIDIHVHGGASYDFMDAGAAELDGITSFHMKHGTTAMLATTVTGSQQQLSDVLESVASYRQQQMPYAQLIGVHLEGPFVNPKWKGAQNEAYMVEPQPAWMEQWQEQYPGLIKLQTLAPEINGAYAYIELLHKHGIVAACGHTDATFDQLSGAVKHGLRHAVHTYNAMKGLHHREPGTLGAVMLHDEITAEIIADGIHVHAAAAKILHKVKGTDRVVLVTDAMSAAGMPDGDYELGGLPVVVEQGVARLKQDGSLAGSTLTMIEGYRFLVQQVGVSLSEASRIASLNPATVLGLQEQYGSIAIGKRADLLLMAEDFKLEQVFISGEAKL